MIGMKDQYFGVEVEMTGITREQAAQALANYGTEPNYVGGGYDKWSVKDPDGKAWSIMPGTRHLSLKRALSHWMVFRWNVQAKSAFAGIRLRRDDLFLRGSGQRPPNIAITNTA